MYPELCAAREVSSERVYWCGVVWCGWGVWARPGRLRLGAGAVAPGIRLRRLCDFSKKEIEPKVYQTIDFSSRTRRF